jgi:hypothetical protein
MNIFNPQLCISKELTNSWAAHIESLTPNKVPIEILEGVPRLKLVHSASAPENWFAIAIPLSPTWAPQDLQTYRSLCFTIVAAEGSGGVVRLEDGAGSESLDFNFSSLLKGEGEEASIEIPLGDFGESLDITSIKLIKFIGYKNSAFYISQIYASP